MIISKTPFRIALSGGGTDLDFYYKKKGGELFSLAINQYVYVHLSPRKVENNYFIQTSHSHFSKTLNKIQHKLIKETLRFYKVKEKLHIGTYTTVPTRTGLGTSSAILIGLIKCIMKLKKKNFTNLKIIKDAYMIERKICGYQGGWQDQAISQVGGLIKLNISKKEKIGIKKIKISNKILKFVNNNLILIYSTKQRESSNVIESQKKNSNLIKLYDEIKSLNKSFIYNLKKNNYRNIAKIFNIHWSIKKKISNKISNKYIDDFYASLIKKIGCSGGKLIGAGGGGFFLMIVENKKKVIMKLKKNKINFLELKPEFFGSKIINY